MNTQDATTATPSPQRRRRWYQFSMRTLLLVLIPVCCLLAWVGFQVRGVLEQRAAVAAITQHGGKVTCTLPPVVARNNWLRSSFVGTVMSEATSVWWEDSAITDEELVHLRGVTQLEDLNLEETQVGDAGLAALSGLTQLKELSLEATAVGDEGLKALRSLTRLKWLYLKLSKVSESAVEELEAVLPDATIFD